ncbi:hypothetical protein MKX01_035270 [Papaver californicum]|nr:hypothetical protein MKX01_035270 [Papaver californicum]
MKNFKGGNGTSSVQLKNHITCCRSSEEDSRCSRSFRENEISVHGVSDKVVGVLGGGQLGQMLCQAASQMGIKVMVLDPLENCPASALAYVHVVGRFDDSAEVEEFAKRCGVLTFEIEHVDVDCQPKASTIRIIQDKYLQKVHFSQHGIPMPEFREINDDESAREAGGSYGYPLMIKSKRLAYDGRGNAVAHTKEDLSSCVAALGGYDHGLYVEKWAPFGKGCSLSCYPAVETFHKDNICHIVKAPAEMSWKIKELETNVAQRAVRSLDGAGVFAVEFFLTKDEQILLNEVAPRTHNSGHQTIESCYTSQYEQHLRAVLGLPLGNSLMKTPAAIMYNLLGEEEGEQGFALAHQLIGKALNVPGASVHWYNKPEIRKQRKMGHITCWPLHEDKIADGQSQATLVGIIMGSDSDLPIMKEAAKVLDIFRIQVIIAGAGGAAHLPGMVASETPLPVVAVPIHGSQLGGLDSVLSMLQMPRGIPTATVGINNAENAALLAVRTLAILYPDMQARMIQYQQDMTDEVLRKGDKLMDLGWEGLSLSGH